MADGLEEPDLSIGRGAAVVAGEVSSDGLPPVVWCVGSQEVHGNQLTEDVAGREGEGGNQW